MTSWKLSAIASKHAVESALERHETIPGWDENIVLSGFEVAPDDPDTWQLDAYVEDKPSQAQRNVVKALFDDPVPHLKAQPLPETDWVSESQKGVDPIHAGRFYVHTPEHAPSGETGTVDFCIPAAQAFGTGQHETTAGCLAMLDHMKSSGVIARDIADIGTGTGLLAFAARALWPHACLTASDIDPVCLPAVLDNAQRNGVPLGGWPGELAMVIAEGMEDDVLLDRAPYDLLIANILAGPLIELAEDFGDAVSPRGHVVLAGLLQTQEAAVRAAYLRAGFRLQARIVNKDWSILWLRRRFAG